MKVKSESEVAQSCPSLSDPMDCSLPGSSIHGIFQARVLEWGAIAFSENGYKRSFLCDLYKSNNKISKVKMWFLNVTPSFELIVRNYTFGR